MVLLIFSCVQTPGSRAPPLGINETGECVFCLLINSRGAWVGVWRDEWEKVFRRGEGTLTWCVKTFSEFTNLGFGFAGWR